jgi:hypothetical protein
MGPKTTVDNTAWKDMSCVERNASIFSMFHYYYFVFCVRWGEGFFLVCHRSFKFFGLGGGGMVLRLWVHVPIPHASSYEKAIK